MRRLRALSLALTVAFVGASCASSHDTTTARTVGALNAVNHANAPSVPDPPYRKPKWPCDKSNPTPSLRPAGSLPAPGQMPTGTFMQGIQKHGRLVVGVDQNTAGFGYRQANGDIDGFDVDLLREVARAIFGDPTKIEFVSVTTGERVPAVANGQVDIVASLLSITCTRWQQIDFTTEYYRTEQGVLVRSNSSIHRLADLGGKKICATRGSTSIDAINDIIKGTGLKATIDPVDLRTDCLVDLEDGAADAITSDNTILDGFRMQDPQTRLLSLSMPIEAERYGMGISIAHPEFVRFVNAVLEELRANGRYEQLFTQDLTASLGIPYVPPPPPEYRS